MEEKVNRYIKGHMMTIMAAILCSFLLLFLGEFFLYRRVMSVNKIVSEGFMQLKEVNKVTPSPTIAMKKK